MYRDMIYTSLAKANPAFLNRLSAYDRLEGFIDTISDFAGDAHFQIEKQIIDQYTQSEEYKNEKNDMKKVSSTLRHIDESVIKMIPDLIEQALMPGSEMMEQLEREVTSAYLIATKRGAPPSDFNRVFGAAMEGVSDLDCVDSEEFEQRVKQEEKQLDCFTMLELVVQLQVWW